MRQVRNCKLLGGGLMSRRSISQGQLVGGQKSHGQMTAVKCRAPPQWGTPDQLNSSAVHYQVQPIHRLQMAIVTSDTCVFFFAKIYNLTDAKSWKTEIKIK